MTEGNKVGFFHFLKHLYIQGCFRVKQTPINSTNLRINNSSVDLSDLEHNSPFPSLPREQPTLQWLCRDYQGSLNQSSCTSLRVMQAPLGKKITSNSPGHTSPNAQQTPALLPGLRKQSAQKAVKANAKPVQSS